MTKTQHTTKSYKYFKNGELVWENNVLSDIVLYNKAKNKIYKVTTKKSAERLMKLCPNQFEIRNLKEENIKIVEIKTITTVIENEVEY